MVQVRRSYADTSIGQIHYRSSKPHGSKSRNESPSAGPLLMLHMSPASSLVYERLMEVLGESRLCIAPDTPGYGNSDSTPDVPTIEQFADVMVEFLDSLGITEPVDLMGYHTGSMTSIAIADRYPDRVRKIVMVSAPIFTQEDLDRFATIYSEEPLWTEDGERLLALWKWFVEFFKVGEVNTVADAGRIFYERLSGREKYWWGHHAAFAFDLASAITRVEKPILVINPGDDLPVFTRRADGLLVNGVIEEHPEWTHGFMDADSREAAAVIERFLN